MGTTKKREAKDGARTVHSSLSRVSPRRLRSFERNRDYEPLERRPEVAQDVLGDEKTEPAPHQNRWQQPASHEGSRGRLGRRRLRGEARQAQGREGHEVSDVVAIGR